ncbi:AAA family ATPase [Bacillus mycoides]|uniref:AAA family ATPase n=1 Tax=Bacillus mycoides TaxID=1405 RepID=UPI002931E19D|nr:AAA family ATPase [Bacillus mycoides]WOA60676.1 AAA family ATPase [Bacillus mycoides]
MNKKIRVSEVEIQNFKNVINGKITFPSSRSQSFSRADVLGIYGQNGSGKTAVIEAFQILSNLLKGNELDNNLTRLINQETDTATLTFTFLIEIDNKFYELVYCFEITKYKNDNFENKDFENPKSEDIIYVSKEELKYKELKKGARPKIIIQYSRSDENDSLSPKTLFNKVKSNKTDLFISYKVNAQLAFKERTSFLFRKEGMEFIKELFDTDVYELIPLLKNTFANNLFIINNQQSSLILANVIIPVHYKKQDFNKGETGYGFIILGTEPRKMSRDTFDMTYKMLKSISKVLKEIIPGLTVELRELSEQTLNDGNVGVRAELIAIRDGIALPIALESDGIKKLISILSSLIVMYNDPNACIVIDELDAGIFEFLLGEVVKILNDSGKGQLLFTSHNLRLLEVLEKDNLVFTSINPEQRYINLKGIKETNNIRDVYIRAIQLGNDEESVYEATDRYDIMDAFEEAGELNFG